LYLHVSLVRTIHLQIKGHPYLGQHLCQAASSMMSRTHLFHEIDLIMLHELNALLLEN
jgi:hypothetical protein